MKCCPRCGSSRIDIHEDEFQCMNCEYHGEYEELADKSVAGEPAEIRIDRPAYNPWGLV